MSTKRGTGRVLKIYEFIKANSKSYPVRTMCKLLGVVPDGYYAWLSEPVSNRAKEDARLLRLIRASFAASSEIYGAPRVFLDLREAGETCSKHRVARLMRENNLRALHGYRTRRCPSVYAMGLLSDAERKSVEPIAARSCADPARANPEHQRLLHFVSESEWSDHAVRRAAAELEFAQKLAELNALANTPKTPRPPKDKTKQAPKGRRNFAGTKLPIERIELHDPIFEAMVAEGRAERIGADESRRLTYKRGGMCCLIVVRTTYRTTAGGESTLATTAMSREVFTWALATPSLIAHIITQKYAMGLPLYRLEEQFARQGAQLDRATMSRYLLDADETFGATIVDAMVKDAIANAFCIATDATGVLVQPIPNESKQRQSCKRGHIFTQVVERDVVIFSYTERETSAAVKALFPGFKGYVQADAKGVYDALFEPPNDPAAKNDAPIEVGCWSHARRKFWEATVTGSVVAREGLARIGRIFELDASWRDKPPSEIQRRCAELLKPHIDAFFAWAETEFAARRVPSQPRRCGCRPWRVRHAPAARASRSRASSVSRAATRSASAAFVERSVS